MKRVAGQYFVVNYTDATKSSITNATLASNATNVGGNNTLKTFLRYQPMNQQLKHSKTAYGLRLTDYISF